MAVAGRVGIACFSGREWSHRRATGGENARHQGAREDGAAEALRRDKVLQTCTKAGGGVRDHGGGVGTALLRYLQLNVGKTNFGTFLAYFFHLGSQLLVHTCNLGNSYE